MKPGPDIAGSKVGEIERLLDALLADEYVLSLRMRDAYRNVHGNNRIELRTLFEGQYESVDEIVADLSARVGMSGLLPTFALANFLSLTGLNVHNERFTKQDQIIEALLDDHESIIRNLGRNGPGIRVEHEDNGTSRFLAALLGQHQKMAGALKNWMR